MQDKVEQFAEAHRAVTGKMVADAARFNHEIVGYPIPAQPELMSDDRAGFRADFMQEELDEFRKAQKEGDLDGAVDAIIDLMYVAAGAMNEMGVAIQPCWDEVHNANMRKKRGAMSKRPGSKGFDAIKPEGWTAPSHAQYLTITSEEVAKLLSMREAGKLTMEELDTIIALRKGEAKVVPVSGLTFPDRPVMPTQVAVFDDSALVAESPINGEKLLIMGYARHGKDTVCELLRDRYGLKFTSSSQFCAEHVVFPVVKKMWDDYNDEQRGRNLPVPAMPNYATVEECFADRANHRALWYDLITAHNTPDKSRLGREIFEENDVYCGIRNAREFHALKNAGVFHWAIWVDASERGMPVEDKSSCTVEPWMADFILDNNGTLEDLERGLNVLMRGIFGDAVVEI
ncbi:MazG-like nucleotide pyrophosphohydrolase [Rhodobacter phage RcSimone-Hastad]|nr:MazG-like nucleotide pyrophosphohydrolase [Rhodobacter phage RcSimone-Hastad]